MTTVHTRVSPPPRPARAPPCRDGCALERKAEAAYSPDYHPRSAVASLRRSRGREITRGVRRSRVASVYSCVRSEGEARAREARVAMNLSGRRGGNTRFMDIATVLVQTSMYVRTNRSCEPAQGTRAYGDTPSASQCTETHTSRSRPAPRGCGSTFLASYTWSGPTPRTPAFLLDSAACSPNATRSS